jgi:hypothetical protein
MGDSDLARFMLTINAGPPSSVPMSFGNRILVFLEQPLFILSVSGIFGIVGTLFYSPVLIICGVCIILAFQRSGLVAGLPILPTPFSAYVVLCISTIVLLWAAHSSIQAGLNKTDISTANLVVTTNDGRNSSHATANVDTAPQVSDATSTPAEEKSAILDKKLTQILDAVTEKDKARAKEGQEKQRDLFFGKFPLGWIVFNVSLTDRLVVERERGIPPSPDGRPSEVDFRWISESSASISDEHVLIALPTIIVPPDYIMIGNGISLLRKPGVSVILNVDPKANVALFGGNLITSDVPGFEFRIGQTPKMAITVEVISAEKDSVTIVLGLRTYSGFGI